MSARVGKVQSMTFMYCSEVCYEMVYNQTSAV